MGIYFKTYGVLFISSAVCFVLGNDITDEQYYSTPDLFHLMPFEKCLANKNHVYCLGTFALKGPENSEVYKIIKKKTTPFSVIPALAHEISADLVVMLDGPVSSYYLSSALSSREHTNFNHSRIHRGVCLGGSKCHINYYTPLSQSLTKRTASQNVQLPHKYIQSSAYETLDYTQKELHLSHQLMWSESFQTCVDNDIQTKYGLRAELYKLQYCKNGESHRSFDWIDMLFVVYVITVLALNLAGTAYEWSMREKHSEGNNNWWLSWSLISNWRRLTTVASNSNQGHIPCFDGLRSISSIVAQFSHIPIVMVANYIANPLELESKLNQLLFGILCNAPVMLQIFLLLSVWTRMRRLLRDVNGTSALNTVLEMITDRYIRITPLTMTVVGFAATLNAHMTKGPLWGQNGERNADELRQSFFPHLFFMQNVMPPISLFQTWYLAMDFQICVLCTIIGVSVLGLKSVRAVYLSLLTMFALSATALFTVVYRMDLKPILWMITPESVFNQFKESDSFIYMYRTAWGNLPSAIIGMTAAYTHHITEKNNVDMRKKKWCVLLFRVSLPMLAIFVISSYFYRRAMPPPMSSASSALFATLDKSMVTAGLSVFILGCISQMQSFLKSFLESSYWSIPGRLSLATLMLHVPIQTYFMGSRLMPNTFSYTTFLTEAISSIVVTYSLALPLTLIFEYPAVQLYNAYKSRPLLRMVSKESKKKL